MKKFNLINIKSRFNEVLVFLKQVIIGLQCIGETQYNNVFIERKKGNKNRRHTYYSKNLLKAYGVIFLEIPSENIARNQQTDQPYRSAQT